MPSGAKKRKAAKKKQGNHSTTHPNPSSASSTHSHGGENENFKEGGQEQTEVGENVVRVERDIKKEENPDKKDGGSSGSSSSGSSSNSDDESYGIKKSSSEALVECASVLDSLKAANSSSGSPAEAIQNEPIEEASEADKMPLLVEKVEMDTNPSPENPVAPLLESVIKEDKIIVQPVEKIDDTNSGPNESAAQENDDRLTVSFNAPTTTTDDGTECEKGSGVNEPLLATRPVRRTSWKSCCGLFDAFSGSST